MVTDLKTLQTARRYQALCDQVRYAPDAPVGEGWEVVGTDLNSSLGWRARAYRNKNNPEEVVVAFRGTKTFKEAYFMDSRIAIGVVPNIQHQIDEWLKQNNLTPTAFAGHSLGGTLASVISVAQGQKPAWVFDTPGVPGYTQEDLKNVTAFQSAQNPINNISAGYIKAGVIHEIPLPPDVVKQMALRQNSLEQLSKSYFVDNEATRAIKTAYKLVSTLQNLGDVHSIDNIGISINQQITLQDDKFNAETKEGPYSAQMLLRLEQANSFTQELIQKVREGSISNNEFIAQRKAAEQALEDAKTSIKIYSEKYPLSEIDKEKLRRLDTQIDGLYTSVKDKDIESVRTDTTIERNQQNLQRNIDREATPMVDQAFAALRSLNTDNINLAIEVLNSLGLKLTEPQEGIAKASLEAIGDLTRSYQRYRVYKREQQNNPKPPAGKPGKDDLPAPGEVFFSDILINVEQYFNAISLVGEKFGNPKIAKIGQIGACAVNIVANTSALLGLGPLAVTPLGAVAAIGMSAITLFSAITGKSSQAQEQAEQLQQALQAISQQIASMEQLMVDLFEKSFENDQLILDAISQGFYEMQINFGKVDRMLNNIAAYLSTMSYENSQGFISLLIDRLHNTLFTTQKVMIGHYERLRTLNKAGKAEVAKIILKNLEDLLYWMETGSKNPILIGTFHEFTSDKNQDLLKFYDLRKYPLEYTLGFLLKFIQNNYPQPGFTLSANDVFNISTWAMTANAYSNFTQTLDDESLAMFPPQEIQKLQGQGARLLSWISQLRSDERFADELFADYLGNLKKLTKMAQTSYLQTNPLANELDGNTVDYEHLMVSEMKDNAKALIERTNAEQIPFQMLAELTGLDTHPDYEWDAERLSFSNQTFSRFASKAASNELILKNSLLLRSATVIREGVYEEIVTSQTLDLDTAISVYKFNNQTMELISQNVYAELKGIIIYDILPYLESAAKKIIVGTKNAFTITLHLYDIESKKITSLMEFDAGNLVNPSFARVNDYNYYINRKGLQTFLYTDAKTNQPKIAISYVVYTQATITSPPIFYTHTVIYDIMSNKFGVPISNPYTILQNLKATSQWTLGIFSELFAEKVGSLIVFYNRNTQTANDRNCLAFAFNLQTQQYISLPALDYSGATNFNLQLKTIVDKNGAEHLYLFCHTSSGLNLHKYYEKDGKSYWENLTPLNRPGNTPSFNYWSNPNHTVSINNLHILGENCLVMSLCDSGGVYMWLYQPSTNRWYKNQNAYGAIARGPQWSSASTHAFVLPGIFSDQDLIGFSAIIQGKLELYLYSLTPLEVDVLQRHYNQKATWSAQSIDAQPELLQIEPENSAPPAENNNSVTLVKEPVMQDGDYTFIALRTTRERVRNTLIANIDSPTIEITDGSMIISPTKHLAEEIYLVIMAAYFSNKAEMPADNFWSWLGDKKTACEAIIVKEWLPAAEKFDKVCSEILAKYHVFQKEPGLKLPNIEKTDDIHTLSEKQLDNLQKELEKYPEDKANFEEARQAYKEACGKLKEFCGTKEVCTAYIEIGLGRNLPLGWRSAELYLLIENRQAYICKIDEDTRMVTLKTDHVLQEPENFYYLLPDATTDLGFNLLLRVGEDIALSAAAPRYISRHEIALRGSLSALEQASVRLVNLHNQHIHAQQTTTSVRRVPAPAPLQVLSLNDLLKPLEPTEIPYTAPRQPSSELEEGDFDKINHDDLEDDITTQAAPDALDFELLTSKSAPAPNNKWNVSLRINYP